MRVCDEGLWEENSEYTFKRTSTLSLNLRSQSSSSSFRDCNQVENSVLFIFFLSLSLLLRLCVVNVKMRCLKEWRSGRPCVLFISRGSSTFSHSDKRRVMESRGVNEGGRRRRGMGEGEEGERSRTRRRRRMWRLRKKKRKR